jgi:hypothetical protein
MRFISDSRVVEKANGKDMVVLAAGLPRCATSSLQAAFEQELGLSPCMHMAHVAPHVNRLKIAYYAMAEENKEKRQAMLHELFDGYQSSSDFPGMMFADDLMDMYPNAKIILNKRKSAEAWAKSITSTLSYFSTKRYYYSTWWWATDNWHWKCHQIAKTLVKKRYGVDILFTQEVYDAHNQWVREAAAKRGREVLEWEPTHGWEPICKFLGKPIPDAPFPHLNDEKTIKNVIAILTVRGMFAWVVAAAVPIAAYWMAARWKW